MKQKSNLLKAFKHKEYRSYYILQFVSFIGTWIQGTAQSWLVYRLTGSALMLGAVSFAGAIPAIFLAPFAGVVADSIKRKYLLIGTQILCLIQGSILIILYFTGIISVWHIFFLAIILGIANSFDMTARQSFIPLLVPKDDLTNAIALNSSMFNAARMIGPAIAGFLIAAYDEGICFVLNMMSYIPILIFLIFVQTQKQIIKKSVSALSHLKEGVIFAWKNKPIRALLMMVGVFSFFGASFTTLMPIFSDQILHAGVQGLGWLSTASGIGAVSSGILLASREKVISIKKMIAIAALVNGICIFGFAFSQTLLLSLVLLAIVWFCFILIFAGSNTLLQAMSPDNLRGRIISLFSTMLMGMYPLGSLAIGYIAHELGVTNAVIIASIFCFCVGIYFSFKVPSLTKDAKGLLDIQKQAESIISTQRP